MVKGSKMIISTPPSGRVCVYVRVCMFEAAPVNSNHLILACLDQRLLFFIFFTRVRVRSPSPASFLTSLLILSIVVTISFVCLFPFRGMVYVISDLGLPAVLHSGDTIEAARFGC